MLSFALALRSYSIGLYAGTMYLAGGSKAFVNSSMGSKEAMLQQNRWSCNSENQHIASKQCMAFDGSIIMASSNAKL